ncbi:MAG: hypothetical protein R2789_17565 [Microthrixaceae bacterium]
MADDFARLTHEAQGFVEAEVGFSSLAGPARARVVDRADWVRANIARIAGSCGRCSTRWTMDNRSGRRGVG